MRVLLIDDHALVRKGVEALLQSRGVDIVASVGSGAEGIEQAERLRPDIILLDMKMPAMTGPETLRALRDKDIDIPVLMLTMSRDESDLQDALRSGAQGYLLKDMEPEDLVPALNAALEGDNVVAKELIGTLTRIVQGGNSVEETPQPATPLSDLTPREYEILSHIAEGQSNKVIARELDISDGTVKLHVKAILRKLEVHSRVEAAVIAVENGLSKKDRLEKQSRS
ncbi:MAG: two-component system response regulator NarL [Gammaproteobacteria bacterium]|nr:MAG: two-component system response regulator NarL [Gammaproteobacteria bacterium]